MAMSSELTRFRFLGLDVVVETHPNSGALLPGEGRALVAESRILLKESLAPDEMAEVLFHEILHTVDLSTSYEEQELTEDQVVRLGRLLWGVLRDNPHLLTVLRLVPDVARH